MSSPSTPKEVFGARTCSGTSTSYHEVKVAKRAQSASLRGSYAVTGNRRGLRGDSVAIHCVNEFAGRRQYMREPRVERNIWLYDSRPNRRNVAIRHVLLCLGLVVGMVGCEQRTITRTRTETAIEYGEKAWALSNGHPTIAANLAIAYYYAGDIAKRDRYSDIAKRLGYANAKSLEAIFSGELVCPRFGVGDQVEGSDLEQEREGFITSLVRRGPAPQEFEKALPPEGVQHVFYQSGEVLTINQVFLHGARRAENRCELVATKGDHMSMVAPSVQHAGEWFRKLMEE